MMIVLSVSADPDPDRKAEGDTADSAHVCGSHIYLFQCTLFFVTPTISILT